jgi:hypothetical protein
MNNKRLALLVSSLSPYGDLMYLVVFLSPTKYLAHSKHHMSFSHYIITIHIKARIEACKCRLNILC